MTPTDGAGAVPAGGGRRSGLQAVWASARPARDRTARCSLHWCRRGSSRLHPVIPGSAGPGRRNRSGAPEGVRPATAAAAFRSAGRGHRNWMRRSALRFPFFRDVVTVRALGEQASDANGHRENDRLHPPPHEVRGRGTIRSSRRERKMVEGASASTFILHRRRNVAARCPSHHPSRCALRTVPRPRYRGAGRRASLFDIVDRRKRTVAAVLACRVDGGCVLTVHSP